MYVNKDKAMRMIRTAVRRSGSQKQFAEDAGVSAQYLSDMLKGRREPARAVLEAVGLEKITIFTPAAVLRKAAKDSGNAR